MKKIYNSYISSFKGFSKEIWILAFVTLINRAGTMVLPFLTKYLKEDINFSLEDVGTIMIFFGLGSLAGSWLGGKLTDKFGFYKVMVFSLFVSGIMFFGLKYIRTFWGFCIGIFSIMSIADMFRPAMFVSLNTYAKPENRTRALTLVRLAINLGFSVGPGLGGLIIISMGYGGLFFVDGSTCIISILIFAMLVKEKQSPYSIEELDEEKVDKKFNSVLKDKHFIMFIIVSFLMALTFFQIFTTVPLYHADAYKLSEFETGLLLSLNGAIVFLTEMPLVHHAERLKIGSLKIVAFSLILLAAGYFIMLFEGWVGILVISVILLSISEMYGFPFGNEYAMKRSKLGRAGDYMGAYTMSFSLAHILASKTGLYIIEHYGYSINWLIMGLLAMTGYLLCLYLNKKNIEHV
ncbi:MDR family MFS transporter [Abyssalbus ytuae]|uniref:MFS transporter n=1 Tax=Abyssalbus ytuae TaxID=2926907 RepID=A0A9E6ZLG0_9FLAO|nr:MFS transporter [Abyssalbus ytuae]UOB16774.1 MFS transporter [Abyssalbus ytuae]